MKSLAIKTETVRVLSGNELSDVAGGRKYSSWFHRPDLSSPAPGRFKPTDSIHHPRPWKR